MDSHLGDIDNETWLVDAGHAIIEKKRAEGADALTPRERLIHGFWIVDYSMRNAGDQASARDLDANYLTRARSAAAALDLPAATATFALSEGELEHRYFDLFDGVCGALRAR